MCRDEWICVRIDLFRLRLEALRPRAYAAPLECVNDLLHARPLRASAVHADAVHQILPARHFLLCAQALLQMIVQLQQSGSLSTPTSGSAVVTAPHAESLTLTHP